MKNVVLKVYIDGEKAPSEKTQNFLASALLWVFSLIFGQGYVVVQKDEEE